MLSSIDWLTYWKIICTSVVLWYGGIALLFYRRPIVRFIAGRQVNRPSAVEIETAKDKQVIPQRGETDILKIVQHIISQIKEVFVSYTPDTSTEQIITCLQEIVEPHGQLKYSEFQTALSEYIQSNFLKIGREPLTAEQLSAVWSSPQK